MLSALFPKLVVGALAIEIPHDAGALIMYGVLAIFVGFIWLGNRHSGSSATPDETIREAGAADEPVVMSAARRGAAAEQRSTASASRRHS